MPENKKGDKFDKSEFKGDQSIVLKASGTVIDENPYPSAPLMVAARSVIPASQNI